MQQSDFVINLVDVKKFYVLGGQQVNALNGVNVKIKKGEFVSIMGPSGSGKSTMMHILGCLDKPSEGEYWLEETNVAQLKDRQLAYIRNKRIGFVFQSFNLIARLSALENVETPLHYGGIDNARQHAKEALKQVGLDKRIHHHSQQLSGGERQRVAIARAIVTNPAIILADEPTGNLDTKTGEEIMNIFRELNNNGATVILVTHEPKVAAQAKRTIRLSDGNVVSEDLN